MGEISMGIRILQILAFIRDLLTGKYSIADNIIATSRQEKCNTCPAKSDTSNSCTACGCWLPLKTRLQESECPLDEWLN